MARCAECGTEVPADARFCPHCGAPQPRRVSAAEQPPLPFSPWTAPRLEAQAGGAGVLRQPAIGPPLTTRQVLIAVVAILLILVLFLVIGQGISRHGANKSASIPVLGIMGELIDVGQTGWGVAFTDTSDHFSGKRAQRGQFMAVGLVVLNHSRHSIQLTNSAASIANGDFTARFRPLFVAWGKPVELNAGHFAHEYTLHPDTAIAGILVFDIPRDFASPHLLVRDLAADSRTFTGAIDLTKEKK